MNNVHRILRLRQNLRAIRPDVAIAMMSGANCLLAFAGAGLGLTILGSERTNPALFPLPRIWERLRKLAYPRLDGLVAQTEESARWLREHTGARSVVVIPNPLDYPLESHEPHVDQNEVLAGERGGRVLLGVGRLDEEKGFDRLLSAFAAIAPRQPDWQLVILGDGELRCALQDQAERLGIAARVHFPGRVGNVADWYRAADIYALTSRYEGFPNTLLEAMAHGLPVVAVDCDTGPREIIRSGVNGLLVRQNDLMDLTGALERLMSDGGLRKRLGAEAISVRERFGTERIASQWEEFMVAAGSR